MIDANLKRAISLDDFTERRTSLRAMTSHVLTKIYDANTLISRAFDDSPLVGDQPDQITPRPTPSGLCNVLDEDTMIALLNKEIVVRDILDAIRKPEVANPKAKTGWAFGKPKKVEPGRRDALIKEIEGEGKGYDPMTFSLEEMFKLHDFTLEKTGRGSDEVLDAMQVVLRADQKVAGLRAALSVKQDEERPVYKLEDIPEHVRLAHNDLADHILGLSTTSEPVSTDYEIPQDAELINLALSKQGLPPIKDLLTELKDAKNKSATTMQMPQISEVPQSADIPKGKFVVKKCADVFKITGTYRQAFSFEIPTWEWDAPHPHVPALDNEYIFNPSLLLRTLYALMTNKRTYLHGHTGSGKTTHAEQIAARCQIPVMRVNFDSEITRMDLIGRDTLVQENGTTVSKFVEGIMPQAMAGPYMMILDEIDFIRPDVAYVMQRVLEGQGLMLTEDGGRVVKPHPMFRIIATGNTVGQGDEYGMYQGARPQSMAMLDRFTVWAHVDYLSGSERRKLIEKKVPKLSKDMVDNVCKYVDEHIRAFKDSKILQPITPRGYLDLGNALVMFLGVYPSTQKTKAINEALDTTILDRCSAQDRAVIKGIINRIFV
ncbi:MAG: hypothetical protein CL557_12290 [Alphaproteobacteria bacterium]|nr:hypothetical protein [Alphaproteobacteria bacterium]